MKKPTKDDLDTLQFAINEMRDLEKEYRDKRKVLQDHLIHLAGVAWGLKPGARIKARGKFYALESWGYPTSIRAAPKMFGTLIKKDGTPGVMRTAIYEWDNPVLVEEEEPRGHTYEDHL